MDSALTRGFTLLLATCIGCSNKNEVSNATTIETDTKPVVSQTIEGANKLDVAANIGFDEPAEQHDSSAKDLSALVTSAGKRAIEPGNSLSASPPKESVPDPPAVLDLFPEEKFAISGKTKSWKIPIVDQYPDGVVERDYEFIVYSLHTEYFGYRFVVGHCKAIFDVFNELSVRYPKYAFVTAVHLPVKLTTGNRNFKARFIKAMSTSADELSQPVHDIYEGGDWLLQPGGLPEADPEATGNAIAAVFSHADDPWEFFQDIGGKTNVPMFVITTCDGEIVKTIEGNGLGEIGTLYRYLQDESD